jgi:hypothetical protein
MKLSTLLLLAALLWAPCAPHVHAQALPLQLKWSELDSHIAGKKISLVLADGIAVEGKDATVEADGLRLNITKTGDRKIHPKGSQLVARQLVTFLRVTEFRHLARIIVPVAAVAVVAAVTASAGSDISEGAGVIAIPVAGAAGGVGAAFGGYYAGKAIDRRVTAIRVIPGK